MLSDLSTVTSNPVTNPIDAADRGRAGCSLSSGDASNAASTALTGVTDNFESAPGGRDYSTALTDLEDSGTTVLYAFLNGYPETVGSDGLISPEFGLLTNTADGAATGQIDALAQLSNTIADEVSALGGGNLTTTPTLIDPGTLDLSVNVSTILNDLAPSGTLTLPISLDSSAHRRRSRAARSPCLSPSTHSSATPPRQRHSSTYRSPSTNSSARPPRNGKSSDFPSL